MRALRVAFVLSCVLAMATLVGHWFAPALATGEPVWWVAFVVWISTFSAAIAIAALGIWEWGSTRFEEVMRVKS